MSYHYNPYIHDADYFSRNDWLARLLTYLSDQMSSLTSSSDSKQLTIAYAAGASLAAITLIYVFGPTFFIDGSNNSHGYGKKKQTVVGLYNPANDCFVNSVLQALAGCGELRKYLVGRIVLQDGLERWEARGVVKWKGKRPILTKALKTMLDRLNERPLHRKTITTRDFIYELERVFRSRISRNQQDAQEFLQIVAQTLAEEYEAQEKVKATIPKGMRIEDLEKEKEVKTEEEEKEKESASVAASEESFEVVKAEGEEENGEKRTGTKVQEIQETIESSTEHTETETVITVPSISSPPNENETVPTEDEGGPSNPKPKHIPLEIKMEEESEKKEEPKIPEFGMPMEGKLESGIQCLVCGFEPKPTASTFVVLTLNVPHKHYATLDDCFNEHLSTEFIDDFQCAKCKLVKTIAIQEKRLSSATDEKERQGLTESIERLNDCLESDPEEIPKNIDLPPASLTSVKSRIAKRTYFAHCPNLLSIHLSRSIFDYYTRKNGCKVSFPEELILGPLLHRSKYKLLGLITHRGSHDSGHYECYRRQNSHPPPYSTPMIMPVLPGAPATTAVPVTTMNELKLEAPAVTTTSPPTSKPDTPSSTPLTPATPATLSTTNLNATAEIAPTAEKATGATTLTDTNNTPPGTGDKATAKAPSPSPSPAVAALTAAGLKAAKADGAGSLKGFPSKSKKYKSPDSRWWRISDDSIKEWKTSDVLGLQKEVYLLFYEKVEQR
ncbi:hypothetical protein TWF694_010361 [Orbilia ellipsospora]|uniref:Ubiquitin carboxyl-terminal hydrolase n=1 Tax=Orbilia ellipsospora TaxID=2528407 RepID=A0AAV9X9M2_9PEZI